MLVAALVAVRVNITYEFFPEIHSHCYFTLEQTDAEQSHEAG